MQASHGSDVLDVARNQSERGDEWSRSGLGRAVEPACNGFGAGRCRRRRRSARELMTSTRHTCATRRAVLARLRERQKATVCQVNGRATSVVGCAPVSAPVGSSCRHADWFGWRSSAPHHRSDCGVVRCSHGSGAWATVAGRQRSCCESHMPATGDRWVVMPTSRQRSCVCVAEGQSARSNWFSTLAGSESAALMGDAHHCGVAGA